MKDFAGWLVAIVLAVLLGISIGIVHFSTPGKFTEGAGNFTAQAQKPNLTGGCECETVTTYIEGENYTRIFKSVEPSVVSIRVSKNLLGFNLESQAIGSGFVYGKYIITNNHVVEDSKRVTVTFPDGVSAKADVLGTDPYSDVAVLKVDRKHLVPAKIGDSDKLMVGQRVFAVGSPFGLTGSMTAGIISQLGRRLTTEGGFSIAEVIQIDAAVNPGNSGGPLVNLEGEVVGVNTAIESRTGTFSGIGLAIPINLVKRVADSIIENKEFKHPWIGISGTDITPEIAEVMHLNNTWGFLVIDITKDGPAEEAGVKGSDRVVKVGGVEQRIGGDVIVGVNDTQVRKIEDLLTYLDRRAEVGDLVVLKVIREGELKEIAVILGARPEIEKLS